jgi:hypothetical protein
MGSGGLRRAHIQSKQVPESTQPAEAKDLATAVQQVLSSTLFERSYRLSQLLRYLTEQTLQGDLDALKEPVIGQRVFGRPADYSSAEDNIVRSNVRQLRLRLDDYYSSEGTGYFWRVAIPKGSYQVSLEPPSPAIETAAATRSGADRRIWYKSVGVAAIILILAAAATYTLRRSSIPAARAAQCLLELLKPGPGQRLLVIVPDSEVQLYQRLTGRTVSLQEYVEGRFLQPQAIAPISPEIARSASALFHSRTTQSFVLDLIPKFAEVIPPGEISVRHPSTLSVKDFETDNALLISGPFGDPWVQLFDRDLEFQIESDPGNQRAHISDRGAGGSPVKEYYNFTDSSGTTVCYARLAYLPGLTPASRVLLAGGPHSASTEAASRFLTRPDFLKTVSALFRVRDPAQLPWFELIVEARAIGNSPWTMRILSHKTVQIRQH